MESGVDWLTVSCVEPELRTSFRELGVSLVHKENQLGEKAAPLTFMGMEGLKAGGCGFVESDAMALMRLSGPTAHSYWRSAFERSTNCSRIDLQLTLRNVSNANQMILDHHREALRKISKCSQPPTVDLRMSNRTGNTLYFNQRTSTTFGRCYNKAIESKLAHYSNTLRYEVQCNGKYAMRVAQNLSSKRDVPLEAAGMVSQWMGVHGLSQQYPAIARKLISYPRRRSTSSKRLAWLGKQVRPAVASLLQTCSMEEVLTALGLYEQVEREYGPIGPTNQKE